MSKLYLETNIITERPYLIHLDGVRESCSGLGIFQVANSPRILTVLVP